MSSARTSAKRSRPVPFVKGFRPCTAEMLQSAVGSFPWDGGDKKRNRETSLYLDRGDRFVSSMDQLDNICYYSNVDLKGNPIWPNLPEPADDASWLATVNEPGQTFDEYVQFVTHRTGKFSPGTNVGKPIIYLLPITELTGDEIQSWPDNGPDLRLLAQWVEAFYDREVIVLDPASIAVAGMGVAIPGQKKAFKPRYDGECKVRFRTATYESYIEGRVSPGNGRYQTHIEGLLSEIHAIRQEGVHTYHTDRQIAVNTQGQGAPLTCQNIIDLTGDDNGGDQPVTQSTNSSGLKQKGSDARAGSTPKRHSKGRPAGLNSVRVIHDAFAVVGVMMTDIFSSPGDLFIAGMAAGGSKVAVLSFARYHPRLRMHFQDWDDYGYAAKSAEYSYYEEGKVRPKLVGAEPPAVLDAESRANYLRRAGKLVMHELAHVYGIDHCIHYHCVMNGTGHLVEDFAAPAHLCAVCLRKLQFRMGFDVPLRYQRLLRVFKAGGLTKEARWIEKRLMNLPTSASVDGLVQKQK